MTRMISVIDIASAPRGAGGSGASRAASTTLGGTLQTPAHARRCRCSAAHAVPRIAAFQPIYRVPNRRCRATTAHAAPGFVALSWRKQLEFENTLGREVQRMEQQHVEAHRSPPRGTPGPAG